MAARAVRERSDGRIEIDTPPDPKTGSTVKVLDRLDFVHALCQQIPDKGMHQARYHGAYSNSKGRALHQAFEGRGECAPVDVAPGGETLEAPRPSTARAGIGLAVRVPGSAPGVDVPSGGGGTPRVVEPRGIVSRGVHGSGLPEPRESSPFTSPTDLAFDSAGGRVFVASDLTDAVFAVSLSTGNRTIVADDATGTGAQLNGMTGIAYHGQSDRIYVWNRTSPSNLEILAIVPSTGDRTTVSSDTVGSGPEFGGRGGLVLASDSFQVIASDRTHRIFSVSRFTGARMPSSRTPSGAAPRSRTGT